MGKKRKSDQAFEVVVEDSREPAAYTIGSQAEQQQAQDQWDEQQEQPQQQHKGGGGYDQAEGDNESRECHVQTNSILISRLYWLLSSLGFMLALQLVHHRRNQPVPWTPLSRAFYNKCLELGRDSSHWHTG
jgi:hypothetical protein